MNISNFLKLSIFLVLLGCTINQQDCTNIIPSTTVGYTGSYYYPYYYNYYPYYNSYYNYGIGYGYGYTRYPYYGYGCW